MRRSVSRITSHVSKSWHHHLPLQLATMIVLIASFVVVSGVITMSYNLNRVLTLWGESMQVSVYFNENSTEQNISYVKKFLDENQKVEKPKYVTKEAALSVFKEQMASYAPDLLSDKDLVKFIPSSFQFGLKKHINPEEQLETMQTLAASLKVMGGVEDVSYGQEWVKSYSTLTRVLSWGGEFFIVIIAISAAFVMANSIHSSIAQRRGEIEVLELVGATANYIRIPFVCEGALMGGVASSLALALSYGVFSSLKNYLHNQIAFLQLSSQIQFIGMDILLAVIIFGVIAGALSSWICVRHINDGWAAIQSKK